MPAARFASGHTEPWSVGISVMPGWATTWTFSTTAAGACATAAERTARNLKEIVETISRVNPDIALLQEVDLDSRRSYRIREVDTLRAAFPGYTLAFAYNYKVCWVPFRCGLRWGAYRQES